ncbi:hypothetical protein Tco_0469576 [Tanacetum coccineum]
MKVFPFSLAYDAKNGGLVREMEKSPLGRILLRNYSIDSISNHMIERMKCWTKEKTGELIHSNTYQTYVDNNTSSNNEWKESKSQNQSNTAIDSFFKAYDVRNIGKESEQGQIKRKDNNNDDK